MAEFDRQAEAISPDQVAMVTAHLAEGEHILWSARPRSADEVRLDATIWGLPLFWAGLIGFMFAFSLYVFAHEHGLIALTVWSGGIPTPLALAPMLLIGIALLAAPWIARARSRHAVFALTDRRLMRCRNGACRSIAIGDLGPVVSDEGADGFGALHIHLRVAASGQGRSILYFRLRGIPDVVKVRRQIAAHLPV